MLITRTSIFTAAVFLWRAMWMLFFAAGLYNFSLGGTPWSRITGVMTVLLSLYALFEPRKYNG